MTKTIRAPRPANSTLALVHELSATKNSGFVTFDEWGTLLAWAPASEALTAIPKSSGLAEVLSYSENQRIELFSHPARQGYAVFNSSGTLIAWVFVKGHSENVDGAYRVVNVMNGEATLV